MQENKITDMEIENARITHTSLGYEDHGILTFNLTLEGSYGGQGFGGYALDNYNKILDTRIGTDIGTEFIVRILNTLEVRNWEDVKNQLIRVKRRGGNIMGIGHILKNKWFMPREVLEEPYWKNKIKESNNNEI